MASISNPYCPGDLFSAARVALSMQRALDNAEQRKSHGTIPATTTIPAREALRWVTTEGARMLGREDQIGSLTLGKLADLVVINASDLNLFPIHDPVSTLVMQTSLANIEAVMIGGAWKKRNGQLLVEELDAKKEQLAQSGRRLVHHIELQGRAA